MNRNDVGPTVSPAPATMPPQPPPPPSMFVQQQPIRFVAYPQQPPSSHGGPPPHHHPNLQMPSQQQQHSYNPHQQQSFHPSSAQHPVQRPPMALSATVSMQQQRPADRSGGGAACLPSPMPMPPQQQTDPTMLWDMQSYARDSGFQSTATRSVVSIATSGYSNLSGITGIDSECGDYYGGYPTGQMCPSGYVQPNMSSGQQQQQQMDPGQFLQQQTAALMYTEAQGELNQVMAATHRLAKLLREDTDVHSTNSAAYMVHNLAKNPENARLIVRSSEMIAAIVAAMRSGMDRRDNEMLKSTTGIFYLLSNTDEIQAEGLEAIYDSGAIPLLIRLLSGECEFEAVLNYSMTVVHNLLSFHPKATDMIRAADAVPPLVRLLSRNHDKFLAIVTDSLRMLCLRHAGAQIKACDGCGPTYLVRILEHSNYEKVLWTTTRLLQVLSNNTCCKPTIVEAGGIQALSRHLAHPSHRLVVNCLEALRNLSDKAMYVEGVENLLSSLIQNLGSSDEKVVGYCVSILYNMTCKNPTNKAFICRQMGIESLARTLNERGGNPQIVEDILGVLRHLTWKWAGVRDARNKLRSIGCLPLVGRYLRMNQLPPVFAQYPGVMIEALALTRNLTMDGGASWQDFRYYEIVKSTGDLAIIIRNMINYADPPRFEKCLEMMEWALLAMAGLCQDDANRQILLADPSIEQMAVAFKNHPLSARSLAEAADKCLTELRKSSVQRQPSQEIVQGNHTIQQESGGYPIDAHPSPGHYQVQSESSYSAGATFDNGGYYEHQQQQPMTLPSPMPWANQDALAAGSIDYDNPGEYFDYGMAMDFDPYDDGRSGGGGAGPSSSNPPGPTSVTADEMNNLRL